MQKTDFNVEEKIWTGPKFELQFDRSKNFGEFCLEKLNEDSDHVMQVNVDYNKSI